MAYNEAYTVDSRRKARKEREADRLLPLFLFLFLSLSLSSLRSSRPLRLKLFQVKPCNTSSRVRLALWAGGWRGREIGHTTLPRIYETILASSSLQPARRGFDLGKRRPSRYPPRAFRGSALPM